MIKEHDVEFHPEGKGIKNWTETQFFLFSVPEEAITGCVYVLARPELGICHSSINIAKGMCFNPWEVAYAAPHMHIPCPDEFSNFKLWNGLEVQTISPLREYRYLYNGVEESCSFDLNFRGLMHPFDTHDPQENCLLPKEGNLAEATGFGDGWANGHFDTIGHITGTLNLHGKSYNVDCVDGMDRSWGPRKESHVPGVNWLHITFGPDLGIHLTVGLIIKDEKIVYEPLRFGYIIEGGERFGITAAKVNAEHTHMLPTQMQFEIVDERGKTWLITGNAIATTPWYHFAPNNVAYVSLFRFECNGRIGYSHAVDVFGLNFMAKGLNARGT